MTKGQRLVRRVTPSGSVRYQHIEVRLKSPPNRKRLTEANVRSLPPKSEQYLVWDDTTGRNAQPGLAVLVSPRGIRSYRVSYRFPGDPKLFWKYLGRVGEVTLEEAREEERKVRRMASRGEDPKADDPAKSGSFRSVVEAYTQHKQIGELGNTSALESQAVVLNKTTEWHHRPIATIRSSEIEKLLWTVRDGSESQRGKTLPSQPLARAPAPPLRLGSPPRRPAQGVADGPHGEALAQGEAARARLVQG